MNFDDLGSPTHNLCVKVRGSKTPFHQVGVGWLDSQGKGTIKLDAGVSLRWDDKLVINLFPRTKGKS